MDVNIEDYNSKRVFNNSDSSAKVKLCEFLRNREKERNSFWLKTENGEFPSLNIAFNREFATANYFSVREKNGTVDWVSKGNIPDLPEGDETIFYYSSAEEAQGMDNAVVISADQALQVAIEFFDNPLVKPATIEWYEL